ncbi:N-methyl-L-tryptophan oxidase [Lacicoccus alkaliphilus]|uniref:N-methyl-L-tryptophan oxidase n=1 Tax=Lacicoccus alkaliphilus DSM 16010 TaxID=1123231 RepID=A0A1M7HMJ0_9BACL|nr:N-methyl-L-tryptophan oxidase [Salinicoccus alkaliphilus]SHM29742.1 N-methyl-L-tryptophan oxidase [Salinicoccus alkaliphilus DSM 16010]
MTKHYEVIVIGAGSMGMAAGYYLAEQGIKTLMIDAFDPPHASGSHSGDTRLIRHACGEGYDYVPLAMRAQALWDDLQTKTSERIFLKTGVVTFGPSDSLFVQTAINGGLEYDLNLDTLSADEINARWPGIAVPDGQIGCYEPDAGVLFSENAIRTFRRLALERGAELKVNSPVMNIDAFADSVKVETNTESFTADKLIISGGAWNKKILDDLDLKLRIQPSRQTIAWFDSDDALYRADDFPGFFADVPTGVYYGFPSIDGSGLKVGRYDNGEEIDPEYYNQEFGALDKDEGDLRGFLGEYMKEANGSLDVGRTCMFTNTPDENFIIDKHPAHDHIAIAAGFSGHGYKFSSAVGEILGELVTKGEASQDISLFKATRPSLQPENKDEVYFKARGK